MPYNLRNCEEEKMGPKFKLYEREILLNYLSNNDIGKYFFFPIWSLYRKKIQIKLKKHN